MGLLLASASCARTVTALPAAGVKLFGVTMYLFAAPAVKATRPLLVMALPLAVPVMDAEPLTVPVVSVVVYRPFPLSTGGRGASVPSDVDRTIDEPPNAMLLSFASLSWTVMDVELVPSATSEAAPGVIVDRVPAIACATVTGTSAMMPLEVARTVAAPFDSAVATPVIESMDTNALPTGTDHLTFAVGIGSPFALSTVAAKLIVEPNAVRVGAGLGAATIDVGAFVTVTNTESRTSGSTGLTART